MLLSGNTGIELTGRCQRYGSVTCTGGISTVPGNNHPGCMDCDACRRMQEMYGTCEYIGETERCTCSVLRAQKNLIERRTESKQSVLRSESTTIVRYRYWLRYLEEQRKEIEKQGLD